MRQIFVLNQWLMMICSQLVSEVVLHQPNLVVHVLLGDSLVGCRRFEDQTTTRNNALTLSLKPTVQAVLEQMQRHTQRFQTKFFSQTQLSEAKEILVEIFGEITTNELLTAIVESAYTICTGMIS